MSDGAPSLTATSSVIAPNKSTITDDSEVLYARNVRGSANTALNDYVWDHPRHREQRSVAGGGKEKEPVSDGEPESVSDYSIGPGRTRLMYFT
jgi:hypothetical protein